MTIALSCSTSPAAVRPNPLTTAPVPFRKKARSSRAAFQMPNDRRAFRLRFRDGRYAPAPFPPSLRLRFTFPFAEPQAEALVKDKLKTSKQQRLALLTTECIISLLEVFRVNMLHDDSVQPQKNTVVLTEPAKRPARLFRYYFPCISKYFAGKKLWFSAITDFNGYFRSGSSI